MLRLRVSAEKTGNTCQIGKDSHTSPVGVMCKAKWELSSLKKEK